MNVLARKAGEEGNPSPRAMGEVRGSLDMRDGAKLSTARQFRRDETFAEKRLWEQLRNRTLEGFKFVRQAPAGPYIADFLCRENKLIFEVDGATQQTGSLVDLFCSWIKRWRLHWKRKTRGSCGL